MTSKNVDYQNFDDDTTDFIRRLKRVMADITLRLNGLEGDKKYVADAVRQLQEIGLVRIDATISPVIDQANDILVQAQALYDGLANSDQVATQQEIAVAMENLRGGVTEFFDTLGEVENKFGEIDTALAAIDADSIGLGNVNNTTDDSKPISAEQADALALKSNSDHTHSISDLIGYVDPQLSAWNWIINGDFSINQRGATTKAQSVGVYGYDRWKGHASGLEQIIESLPSGEYTLSWGGGGNGSIDGNTSAVSPVSETIVNGNISVIVPDTATDVCLMLGVTEGVFIARAPALELDLCLRYFEHVPYGCVTGYHVNTLRQCFFWRVHKRTVPSVEIVIIQNGAGVNIISNSWASYTTVTGCMIKSNAAGTTYGCLGEFNFDAEF